MGYEFWILRLSNSHQSCINLFFQSWINLCEWWIMCLSPWLLVFGSRHFLLIQSPIWWNGNGLWL